MKTWTTNDGKVVPIKEMSDSHLLNTIRFIERKAKNGLVVRHGGCGPLASDMWCSEEDLYGKDVFRRFPEYKFLVQEKERRGQENDRYCLCGSPKMDESEFCKDCI